MEGFFGGGTGLDLAGVRWRLLLDRWIGKKKVLDLFYRYGASVLLFFFTVIRSA